ncbi:hypothetical protein D9758_005897 [Tetrapyrgos nigripes]|uniref:Gas1-like protein n=1 Tax=Tetrapyrgos nigripes TaxID=182062 RepID=A0A8H5LHH3_9AGAR|nr:hypothetical protein D9758_005897 [Tetrapyrgos nigripes]
MFSKTLSTFALSVLAISVHVNGHTLMTPALGVQGAGARSDVQVLALAGNDKCGKMNVAQNIDTSTPVAAAADGTFTVTATNFNRNRDGSRQLSATMDTTATGNSFNGQVTITQNGDPRPAQLGSDQIVAQLPAGTTCTGGASGNLCLVSFKNDFIAGFGNCVVVSQGAAAAGNAVAAPAPAPVAGAANAAGAAAGKGKGAGLLDGIFGQAKGAQAGSRAARSLLAELTELEARGEPEVLDFLAELEIRGEDLDFVKRGIIEWIWA